MTSGLRLTFTVNGEKQLDQAVLNVKANISDLRPLWYEWQLAFFAAENDLFEEQPWAGLQEPYASWKAKHYPGKGILQRSSPPALRQSLTSKGGSHVFRATPTMMEIGTSIPYAGYHQEGARLKGGGYLPKRRPLNIDNQYGESGMVGYFGRALAEWSREKIVRAWASPRR